MYDAIIIGAGVAGLSAALRLRKRGDKVLVVEKNAYIGGKMNQYADKGYRWDTGPSLFTIPNVVDELYELYGRNPRDYYDYHTDDTACRYFFKDGTRVRFYTDRERLKQELTEKFGAKDTAAVDGYLDKSREKYDTLGQVFLQNSIHKFSELPWGEVLKMTPKIAKMDLFKSLNTVNKKKFDDPRLVQIFNRYPTYNGSNPYEASGIYSMIAHLEQNIGTFFPKKGMRAIVEGLYKLGQEVGVEYQLGVDVSSCSPSGTSYTVKTAEKEYTAKRLVCAMDCVNFYKNILKDEKLHQKYKKQENSTSALIYYLGVKKEFPELGLHNIFFSEDYKGEFKHLFGTKEIPVDSTVYVHISSKVNPEDAAQGGENWFVMQNMPAGIDISEAEQEVILERVLSRLEKALGKDIKPYIETKRVWTPKGIELDTGAYLGSVYGAASNTKTAALSRHPNFSKKYDNLYFCGVTVHPGGGIPLAIQSAKIVDKLVARER
jgi:phytoene desaturase